MTNKLKIKIVNEFRKLEAFTLAEVLITISIIGIVAAITIPIIIPSIQERVDSYRHSNIVHKVTKATDVMKSLGQLGKFQNTDEFVDVLQQHLKIIKRCDSENISECWPTEKVITTDGKEFEVKNAKTRKNLGFKNNQDNPNVGLILNDGASLILTYNADDEGLDPTDETVASAKRLPVGTGTKEFLEFTTNSTSGLAFVVDVNGAKKPNSETIETKMHDIRNLNNASFTGGCKGTELNGQCYVLVDSYSALDCSVDSQWQFVVTENSAYCGTQTYGKGDKWAGARKACKDRGMRLADFNELVSICNTKAETLGLPSATYYSNTQHGFYAKVVLFPGCSSWNGGRSGNYKAICLD